MSAAEDPRWRLRVFGVIWVLIAPVVFAMAAISTVRSETTYRIQLAAFSAVAVVSFVAGVGGLFRRSWAAFGMLVLSWLGAVFFLGSALLLSLWPLVPGAEATFHPIVLSVSLGIALTGVPFIVMARSLRALGREQTS
jgi:hypothetical protein